MRGAAARVVCSSCFTVFPNPPPTICPKCRTPRSGPTAAQGQLPGIGDDVSVALNVVGGCGFRVPLGARVVVDFGPEAVRVRAADAGHLLDEIPESDLLAVDVGGPGQVTSGGGYIGGGFGVTGFLAGAAAASIMNDLTTKSSILTTVAVLARNGELHGLLSDAEPYGIRIRLSPVYTRLRWR
jgi:hypothetical protein